MVQANATITFHGDPDRTAPPIIEHGRAFPVAIRDPRSLGLDEAFCSLSAAIFPCALQRDLEIPIEDSLARLEPSVKAGIGLRGRSAGARRDIGDKCQCYETQHSSKMNLRADVCNRSQGDTRQRSRAPRKSCATGDCMGLTPTIFSINEASTTASSERIQN
jgi:hypothetical protein